MGAAISNFFRHHGPPVDPYADMTPEEIAQDRISSAYNDNAHQGPTSALVAALSALKQHYPANDGAPRQRTLSGGDVIGLQPEMANALLDRVQRQNELDAATYQHKQDTLRAEAQVRGGRIFSAREAEKAREHADKIEQMRISGREERDRAIAAKGEYFTMPGLPAGYMGHRKIGANGEHSVEIVQAPVADGGKLPEKPAPTEVYGENLINRNTGEVVKNLGAKPETPGAITSRSLRVLERLQDHKWITPGGNPVDPGDLEDIAAEAAHGNLGPLSSLYLDPKEKAPHTVSVDTPEGKKVFEWKPGGGFEPLGGIEQGKSNKATSADLLRQMNTESHGELGKYDPPAERRVNAIQALKDAGFDTSGIEKDASPPASTASAPPEGASYDDESKIPEGTWYQDAQGKVKHIVNGKPVEWDGK